MVVHGGYDGWWRGGGWFLTVFYGMFHQKSDWVIMQGFSARTFSTSLYGKLWEHVIKIALKKSNMGAMTLQL